MNKSVGTKNIFMHSTKVLFRPDAGTDGITIMHMNDYEHYFSISGVAAFIWKSLDGKSDVGSILKKVHARYEASEAQIEKDMLKLLKDLQKQDLIEEVAVHSLKSKTKKKTAKK